MYQTLEKDCEYVFKNVDFSKLKDSTLLITGVAGFLGFNFLYNIIYASLNGFKPKKIIATDNFFVRYPKWIKEIENKYDFIKIIKHDIIEDSVEDVITTESIDYVVHLASIASPIYYRKYPIQTIDANVWGLRKLLDYFSNKNLKNLLFYSSSEVYGDPFPEFIPTPESYRGNVSCMGPRSCYDEAKRFGETLCYYYNQVHQMPITIARPFNNYGIGMDIKDKRVVADFALSILNDEDIVLYSDGSPTRTFCYIADAMVGYWKTLFYNKFDVFNIGNDKPEISVNDLAEIYKKVGRDLFSYSGNINYKINNDKEYLSDNPSRRCPDISKANKLLNFIPTILPEEGVRNYLSYLKEVENK
jgi:UDP-glucuronate decarboxylase